MKPSKKDGTEKQFFKDGGRKKNPKNLSAVPEHGFMHPSAII
jgi:hypothetical protein